MSFIYELTHRDRVSLSDAFTNEAENEREAAHMLAVSLGLDDYGHLLSSWGTPTFRVTSERIYDAQLSAVDVDAQRTVVALPGGQVREFPKASTWHKAGQFGILTLPAEGGFQFSAYHEQRLRRLPARDMPAQGAQKVLWAWQLDGAAPGERGSAEQPVITKAYFVPGTDGRYVEDLTEEVKLDVPPEFFELCESRGITPEQALRGFIADVCGLQSYVSEPREDRYGSNGSDERNMASDYFDRAHFPVDAE